MSAWVVGKRIPPDPPFSKGGGQWLMSAWVVGKRIPPDPPFLKGGGQWLMSALPGTGLLHLRVWRKPIQSWYKD